MYLDVSHINQLIELQIFLNNRELSVELRLDKLIAIACTLTHADEAVIFVKNNEEKKYESVHAKHRQGFSLSSSAFKEIKKFLHSSKPAKDGSADTTTEFFQRAFGEAEDNQTNTYSITPIDYSGFDAQLMFIWGEGQQDFSTQYENTLKRLVVYFLELYKHLDFERSTLQEGVPSQRISSKGRVEDQFQDYLGSSFETKKLLAIADRVAATDSSVLIYGESGVGKEVLAEHIYRNSLRANRPFIKLNCAAIPEQLLESELFGHRKGSFTNALYDRKGKFLIADKGSLFLDEIGELSLAMQAKILRALQNKTIEPVGSDQEISVDVRIIAATNKVLSDLVQQGRFREDLYYRLHVIPIHIIPLRQRREEILELAEYFFNTQKHVLQKDAILGFSDECKNYLENYDWPGNVRELQNLVQRGIILSEDSFIDTEDIFSHAALSDAQASSETLTEKSMSEDFQELLGDSSTLKEKVDACKRLIIENELRYTRWNQSETAKRLDIQRSYLSRLIKALNVRRNK